MRRLINVTDALSQLGNVLFLPRPHDTNANESISARCHRENWTFAIRVVNLLCFWDPDHCRAAYDRDIERARSLVEK